LAPPHQPLAPAIETLARLGQVDAALAYAARWHEGRQRYFGVESSQVRQAAELRERIARGVEPVTDAARGQRLRAAIAAYWKATFVNYDVTREQQPVSLDRDL
jgi:hypothetical protein